MVRYSSYSWPVPQWWSQRAGERRNCWRAGRSQCWLQSTQPQGYCSRPQYTTPHHTTPASPVCPAWRGRPLPALRYPPSLRRCRSPRLSRPPAAARPLAAWPPSARPPCTYQPTELSPIRQHSEDRESLRDNLMVAALPRTGTIRATCCSCCSNFRSRARRPWPVWGRNTRAAGSVQWPPGPARSTECSAWQPHPTTLTKQAGC